jgi:hypothetical protein
VLLEKKDAVGDGDCLFPKVMLFVFIACRIFGVSIDDVTDFMEIVAHNLDMKARNTEKVRV